MFAAVFDLTVKPNTLATSDLSKLRPVSFSPFSSELLTCDERLRPDGNTYWVGEGPDPFGDEFDCNFSFKAYSTHFDYEGAKLTWLHSGDTSRLVVHRTGSGSSPLYVSQEGSCLAISWRMRDAVDLLRKPKPDIAACRYYLAHGPAPTRNQVIDGVSMLWPGESMEFSGCKLVFREVEPIIALPSDLSMDARITDVFIEHIRGFLKRHQPAGEGSVMIEVSAGFDSSCVLLGAVDVFPDLTSYGLRQGGVMGVQQTQRRHELVSRFGLRDYEHSFETTSPFDCLTDTDESPSLLDDMYQTACMQAISEHPLGPPKVLLTGIGGDELTMYRTERRRIGELPGQCSSSAITGAVGRAGMFMKAGIWVRSPLISQDIVNFCRALPQVMKEGRLLNILALARAGFSDGFLFPRYQEHYGNFVREAATRFDFDAALASCALLDLRVQDPSSALLRAQKAVGSVFDFELVTHLYHLVKLEKLLRAYI